MGKSASYLPEIAEAIFEVANYDEKLAEEIWRQQGSDDVLIRAFEKTDKDLLTWDDKPVERKNVDSGRDFPPSIFSSPRSTLCLPIKALIPQTTSC